MLNAISFTNADSDQPKKLIKYGRSTYWESKGSSKDGKEWNGKCLVVVPVFARARLCLYFFLWIQSKSAQAFFAFYLIR